MFENDFSEENTNNTNLELDISECGRKGLICGLYHILNNFEQHFDTISTRYKKIALTWILATYVGIGFLLSSDTSLLPFNHLLAVCLVCFLGTVGVIALWHLDINVYHRFWIAIYIEEIMMEKKYDFLLSSSNTAMLIDETRGKISSQNYLYMIAVCLFLSTCGFSLFFLLINISLSISILSLIFFIIMMILIPIILHKISLKLKEQFNTLIKIKSQELEKNQKRNNL